MRRALTLRVYLRWRGSMLNLLPREPQARVCITPVMPRFGKEGSDEMPKAPSKPRSFRRRRAKVLFYFAK